MGAEQLVVVVVEKMGEVELKLRVKGVVGVAGPVRIDDLGADTIRLLVAHTFAHVGTTRPVMDTTHFFIVLIPPVALPVI